MTRADTINLLCRVCENLASEWGGCDGTDTAGRPVCFGRAAENAGQFDPLMRLPVPPENLILVEFQRLTCLVTRPGSPQGLAF